MTKYVLPDLTYDYGALEPHISGKIMQLHHDKHHKGYVDGANAAAEALDLVILVHPLHPAGLERVGHPPELAAIAAFPLETALATASRERTGVILSMSRVAMACWNNASALRSFSETRSCARHRM